MAVRSIVDDAALVSTGATRLPGPRRRRCAHRRVDDGGWIRRLDQPVLQARPGDEPCLRFRLLAADAPRLDSGGTDSREHLLSAESADAGALLCDWPSCAARN